ncbi:hypothetical protein F8388_011621 [Cannabis sativa]|uniref:Uncharacterized protein n=1 Tax=Cannabis sativa TaxID=3483 RepID=A0A7J6GX20_CANSA|nr:hypothetical protein F8388_011621 [Cannabis sativa]
MTGSLVNLTTDWRLELVDTQGKEVWSLEIVSGEASHAVMQGKRNFVIFGSEKLKESFDHPNDTFLLGQSLRCGEGPIMLVILMMGITLPLLETGWCSMRQIG